MDPRSKSRVISFSVRQVHFPRLLRHRVHWLDATRARPLRCPEARWSTRMPRTLSLIAMISRRWWTRSRSLWPCLLNPVYSTLSMFTLVTILPFCLIIKHYVHKQFWIFFTIAFIRSFVFYDLWDNNCQTFNRLLDALQCIIVMLKSAQIQSAQVFFFHVHKLKCIRSAITRPGTLKRLICSYFSCL